MPQKMRPLRLLASLTAVLAVGWVCWNALGFFPGVWARYRGPRVEQTASTIDTTLFQGDSGVSADTAKLSQDSSLTGLLTRIGPELGVAKRTTGAIKSPLGDLPLYSLLLHKGLPLAEVVARSVDSLERLGFTILESTENPHGTWPWACRLGRDGKPVAILRARIGTDPGKGAYALSPVFWADSLSAGELTTIPRLPPGSILALPAKFLAEPRLRALAAAAQVHLAVLARLETSRIPPKRQEEDRLLLHHKDDEIRHRLDVPGELKPAPEGLVLVDGDRGAADPGLSVRLGKYCKDRSLWLLDATTSPTSRLSSDALEAGAAILPASTAGGTTSLEQAVEGVEIRIEKSGQSLFVWPLDSTTASQFATNLPLFSARGIEIRAPQPLKRHTGTGD